MTTSFLPIVKRAFGDGNYAGDEHGGASGASGQGLPLDTPSNFMFATGIECSYPTIRHGKLRRDLLDECGHYDNWRTDLDLVEELGLRVLRYGLPYYRTHRGPDRYDWSFADEVMNEIRKRKITPILDLMHFGVPDWLGNYQNPELPVHFARYASAVAERYPWVRWWTPVNEMYVTARVSARDGLWNEQLKSDAAYITATKHLVAANILATHQITRHCPSAVFVQAESAEYMHDAHITPSPAMQLGNKLRFLALDLFYGHPLDTEVLLFALDNGLTRAELEWFMAGEPPGHQVMGNDYYGRNERITKPDGTTCSAEDVLGWYQITKDYYDRYRRPVMHTETNTFDPDLADVWLWKQWMNVLRMRSDGVPVLGFTWYSLTDQIDWDVALAEKNGTVNPCGLYDLKRNIRRVGESYKMLLREYGQIAVVPHSELLTLSAAPARLRTAI
jgi:hypothetical protein